MKPETIDITNKHERYQFTAYVGHAFSEMGLLGEYETAVNIIIKNLKDTKTRIDVVAHPVLFMMRHSLELGYKENFEYLSPYSKRQASKTILGSHDLQKLHKEFKEHFDLINTELHFDSVLIAEFQKYYISTDKLITELGAKEASTFRYLRDVKGKRIFESSDTIDIGEIKELYDKAITMLAHTSDLISPYTDYQDLLAKVPDFRGGIGIVQMTIPSFQQKSLVEKLDKLYEKLDQLKWKDTTEGQELVLITVGNNCYLVPVRQ